MTTQFVPVAGLEQVVGSMPGTVAALRKAGERIEKEAVRFAPKRGTLPKGRRRHYADMFDTQAGIDGGQARATVNNRHFTALFVEFGTVNNPAYAPLRRALDAAGGKAL